ncbi:MAG: hypothetical protein L0241_13455, partial [Planctomycetia bacterium]|nr:hypothetical protein [Planctomycetia bacterium]
ARVSERDWPAALEAIRASLADVPDVQHWFDEELGRSPYHPPIPFPLRLDRLGFDGHYLNLDAAAFGVRDVAGAARLCEQLLNYRNQRIAYSQASDDALVAAKKIAELRYSCDELRYSCDEQERAILRLHLGSEQLQQTINRLETMCNDQAAIVQRADAQLRELDQRLRRERRLSLLWPLRAAKRALRMVARK